MGSSKGTANTGGSNWKRLNRADYADSGDDPKHRFIQVLEWKTYRREDGDGHRLTLQIGVRASQM